MVASFSLAIALPKFKVVAEAADSLFPSFLPKDVNTIKDPFARTLATRIQRLPVS
ncbi:alpha/beta fold hydrolase, partial [Trifolium pratense]